MQLVQFTSGSNYNCIHVQLVQITTTWNNNWYQLLLLQLTLLLLQLTLLDVICVHELERSRSLSRWRCESCHVSCSMLHDDSAAVGWCSVLHDDSAPVGWCSMLHDDSAPCSRLVFSAAWLQMLMSVSVRYLWQLLLSARVQCHWQAAAAVDQCSVLMTAATDAII